MRPTAYPCLEYLRFTFPCIDIFVFSPLSPLDLIISEHRHLPFLMCGSFKLSSNGVWRDMWFSVLVCGSVVFYVLLSVPRCYLQYYHYYMLGSYIRYQYARFPTVQICSKMAESKLHRGFRCGLKEDYSGSAS